MPAFTPQPQGITAHWPLLIYSDVTRKFTLGAEAHGEREAIMGVWGQSPQWGPGAEPLVRGAEAESFFCGCTYLGLGKLGPF